VPLSFGVPALGQFERFLRNRLLIEAPYRSEGTHGGMSDYFMAARKFAMPFTMVTGMLLSLVGAMSAFGSGNGAGMKQLKVGVVLLSLGAMVVGGVLVWRRAPVERAEKMARELEKARETLRRELRRMVADAEREWLRILAEHLRDQPAELRVALEAQLETHAQEQSKSGQEEHGRVERQKAGLANTERQLVEARSRREALGRSFDQLRDKLLQMFGEMQREASRRPSPPAPRGQVV
jgi:hypothetical protein